MLLKSEEKKKHKIKNKKGEYKIRKEKGSEEVSKTAIKKINPSKLSRLSVEWILKTAETAKGTDQQNL